MWEEGDLLPVAGACKGLQNPLHLEWAITRGNISITSYNVLPPMVTMFVFQSRSLLPLQEEEPVGQQGAI